MNDKLIRVFFDSSLTSKTELFELIAEQANPEKKAELYKLLQNREAVGSTLIAEKVILPHLESEEVLESQILFIKLRQEIDWDEQTGPVQLAIVIILKKNEEQAIKVTISQFTRTLADEEYLAQLLLEKEAGQFEQMIRRNNLSKDNQTDNQNR
ncbi:PTS sugar transporter subunit IIA [Enterococcus sp. AZ072]|uniref:PTS sugar transporter subunit IIA n=1 Tax=unclassified Enterococcus TaxID=2608891 RepID=UPI003D2705EB